MRVQTGKEPANEELAAQNLSLETGTNADMQEINVLKTLGNPVHRGVVGQFVDLIGMVCSVATIGHAADDCQAIYEQQATLLFLLFGRLCYFSQLIQSFRLILHFL